MKTYTTDGKCLACLLERREVKLKELHPGIWYEHVCLDLRMRDIAYTPDIIITGRRKPVPHHIITWNHKEFGPGEWYILFDKNPRSSSGMNAEMPVEEKINSEKLRFTLLSVLQADIDKTTREELNERVRLEAIMDTLKAHDICNGRVIAR